MQGSTLQIWLAYSEIVRSLEKVPEAEDVTIRLLRPLPLVRIELAKLRVGFAVAFKMAKCM